MGEFFSSTSGRKDANHWLNGPAEAAGSTSQTATPAGSGQGGSKPALNTISLDAIEVRVSACLAAVNAEGSPAIRMLAWGLHGATIIRMDVPALVAEVRRLRALACDAAIAQAVGR